LPRARHEIHAVGKHIADEKIGDGGNREIAQNFHQRVDLVLLAHGAEFEKSEPGMHRKHHHRAEQNE
jgi:hypothetical protein